MIENANTSGAETLDYLTGLMGRFRTQNLANVSPEAFQAHVEGLLGVVDAEIEGYRSPGVQRDLSVRFHWGHQHDFGRFTVPGRMGVRHIQLLATFVDEFGAFPRDLSGARVLDIGAWTGGTSLLLSAMGAQVVAIEEVRKYAEALRYLVHSFGLDEQIDVRAMSLYECNEAEFYDSFDYVLFAGVIYHLTDPVLGARIAYNALKDGGRCLVETAAIPNDGRRLEYHGPEVKGRGSREELSRGGWNWFVPSADVLGQMLLDAGFAHVQTREHLSTGRAFAVADRDHHRDINRAGLSVRYIR